MNACPNPADLKAWKQAYRSIQIARAPDCLSEAQFVAMVMDNIHGVARLKLANHIVQCQHCTDVYQLLLRLPSFDA